MIRTNHDIRVNNQTTSITVPVPETHYHQVTNATHSFRESFVAAHELPYLTQVMGTLASRSSGRGDAIRAAQSLAVCIDYATDRDSTDQVEFVRYPAETLVDGLGDCEDKAILLAGLLSRPPLNCRTALLIVPFHCATLVARGDVPQEQVADDPISVTLDGTEYVYLEAIEAFKPGNGTPEYADRPHIAAFDGHWTVLDAEQILDYSRESADRLKHGQIGDIVTSMALG